MQTINKIKSANKHINNLVALGANKHTLANAVVRQVKVIDMLSRWDNLCLDVFPTEEIEVDRNGYNMVQDDANMIEPIPTKDNAWSDCENWF